jgi:hypothetical protein
MTLDGPPNHTNDQEMVWREEGGRQAVLMEKETGEPDILVVKKGIVGILKESCKKSKKQASFSGRIRIFI